MRRDILDTYKRNKRFIPEIVDEGMQKIVAPLVGIDTCAGRNSDHAYRFLREYFPPSDTYRDMHIHKIGLGGTTLAFVYHIDTVGGQRIPTQDWQRFGEPCYQGFSFDGGNEYSGRGVADDKWGAALLWMLGNVIGFDRKDISLLGIGVNNEELSATNSVYLNEVLEKEEVYGAIVLEGTSNKVLLKSQAARIFRFENARIVMSLDGVLRKSLGIAVGDPALETEIYQDPDLALIKIRSTYGEEWAYATESQVFEFLKNTLYRYEHTGWGYKTNPDPFLFDAFTRDKNVFGKGKGMLTGSSVGSIIEVCPSIILGPKISGKHMNHEVLYSDSLIATIHNLALSLHNFTNS